MKQIILFFMVAVVLVSCTGRKTHTVTVSTYSIDIPKALSKTNNLNQDASLQYQDTFNDLYVIVIDEPIKDFENVVTENGLTESYPLSLEGYARLILDNVDPAISFDSIPEFEESTVNGIKTVSLSLRGVWNKHHIYWKCAFFQGEGKYYQVMVWTLDTNRKKYEKDMLAMINSFREIK